LNVSKKEQSERLIKRIEDPSKNWKFEEQDVKEREFWNEYQKAYEDAINATSTEQSPWYIIPADDKKNMRLIVGSILVNKLKSLEMDYPKMDVSRQKALKALINKIRLQDNF
jgi:polyphosphate kinase 2 (PPK2 family)